ncbi:hypothetical protein AGMMS4956_08170 [Bacteroidia bacterium]|nr:hypothetical protein AGMMS4956_08170 [Bacteroidia bacterium]
MKNIQKIALWGSVAALAVVMASCGAAQKAADKDTAQWRYEIEPVGVGAQGTYLIKVWSYSKKTVVAMEQAKKNAVHGIIFKGFTGGSGLTSQKPMAPNANVFEEHKDYFESFFANGGKYMQFVNISNSGAIAAGDRVKVGKEYKVGVVVSVNKDALRKELENAGIIQKLGGIF